MIAYLTLEELLSELRNKRASGLTYEALAAQYPPRITRAHIHALMHKGWDPNDPHIRAALNLAPMQPVLVCRSCGEAHATKRCTKRDAQRAYKDLLAWPEQELREAILRAQDPDS